MSFLTALVPWWGRLLAIGALTVACMGWAALKMHQHDQIAYDKLATEFRAFKDDIAALGRIAQKAADDKHAQDIAVKEKANEDQKRALADAASTIAKLRAQRPSAYFVPAAPAASRRPDLLCFDRAEYFGTDGSFTESARGLADEGTKNTVNLDNAKVWAKGVK